MYIEKISEIIDSAVSDGTLKKIVFSKPCDQSTVRSAAVLMRSSGKLIFQLETFTKDNKAFHKNFNMSDASKQLAKLALEDYMQTNIITASGECEIKRSKSGSVFIGNKIKAGKATLTDFAQNRTKSYILDDYLGEPFLMHLGITDKTGRIHDKMQAKYRQTNRFIEIAGDICKKLPKDKKILVYDLCCGKSYLSFALYFYLERILGLDVEMLGADLKSDVVDYCNEVAKKSSMTGLHFVCGDISTLSLDESPDIVVSLHACDVATDIVLAHAVKSKAKIILSTPCCHHELFAEIKNISDEIKSTFGFVLEHSMTSQKLCEVLTDSLRAETLKAYGYKTEIMELVSPDDTPKNLLIRAVLKEPTDGKVSPKLARARAGIGTKLMLEKLLD